MPQIKTSISIVIPPELHGLVEALSDRAPLMNYLGGRAAKATRDHFRARDSKPSKSDAFFGSDQNKSHWWGKVAGQTSLGEYEQDHATVEIAEPQFALQLYGGTSRPKTHKNLAIPLKAEMRGKSAQKAVAQEKLEFWMSPRSKKKFFVKRGPGNVLDFYFVLKPEVTVPRDPNALPDLDVLGKRLGQEAVQYLTHQGGATA